MAVDRVLMKHRPSMMMKEKMDEWKRGWEVLPSNM